MSQLDDALYAQLNDSATTLISAFDDALSAEGVPHSINRFGTLFSVFFTDRDVRCYEDAKSQDTDAFARFFHAMLAQGIYMPPSAFEAYFVSRAHTPDILERIIAALPAAAKAAASPKG